MIQLHQLPAGITRLLNRWTAGDQAALDTIVTLLYDQLRREADRHLHQLKQQGATLQPTLLINEAYMKLRKKDGLSFLNRDQFFWFASRMIRHLIVDHIRAKSAQKRQAATVLFDEDKDLADDKAANGLLAFNHNQPEVFLAINEALDVLEKTKPRQAQVVVLRYLLGASVEETAAIMAISPTTVKLEWRQAKPALFKLLKKAERSS